MCFKNNIYILFLIILHIHIIIFLNNPQNIIKQLKDSYLKIFYFMFLIVFYYQMIFLFSHKPSPNIVVKNKNSSHLLSLTLLLLLWVQIL